MRQLTKKIVLIAVLACTATLHAEDNTAERRERAERRKAEIRRHEAESKNRTDERHDVIRDKTDDVNDWRARNARKQGKEARAREIERQNREAKDHLNRDEREDKAGVDRRADRAIENVERNERRREMDSRRN